MQTSSVVATAPAKRSDLVRFFAVFFSVLLLLWLLPFLLLRFNLLPEKVTPAPFVPVLTYPFEVKADADIVIFGDSSALYGLDPRVMSKVLGRTVVNLSNTSGNLVVVDDLPLEVYLRHNRTPKLIVFYILPWWLDYQNQMTVIRLPYEGQVMLLRFGGLRLLTRYTRRNPKEMWMFPFRFYKSMRLSSGELAKRAREGLGHVPVFQMLEEGPLQPSCRFPDSTLGVGRFDTVAAFVRKYSAVTQVMVYIPSLPACKGIETLEGRDYSALGAPPPRVLPTQSFLNDGAYGHLYPLGNQEASEALSAAIRQALDKSGSAQH